jgi:hypothetical protein
MQARGVNTRNLLAKLALDQADFPLTAAIRKFRITESSANSAAVKMFC